MTIKLIVPKPRKGKDTTIKNFIDEASISQQKLLEKSFLELKKFKK